MPEPIEVHLILRETDLDCTDHYEVLGAYSTPEEAKADIPRIAKQIGYGNLALQAWRGSEEGTRSYYNRRTNQWDDTPTI